MNKLIEKYNIPVPRYTSYPPVPQWQTQRFTNEKWVELLRSSVRDMVKEGISLYIHLPYCESLCTYCGCNTRITVNHAVEKPYIQAVLQELKTYLAIIDEDVKINELHLGGGTPTFFSPGNLRELINGIFLMTQLNENADLSFEGHPNNTSYRHLEELRNLGFNRVSFGVQDLSPRVQEAINRIQPIENVEKVMQWARQLGYTSVNFDLVYGLPFQTMEDLQHTVNTILPLKPDRIAYYSYAHVPWKSAGQRKFTEQDLPLPQVKFDMFSWARKSLTTQGYVAIGMDHFALVSDSLSLAYRQKNLHRNFMGYTHKPARILIGLGCSAISELPSAYAQNILAVEPYLQAIEKNELPVNKGHVLTATDKMLKQKINELMCVGSTSYLDLPYEYRQRILYMLLPLQNDGLVEITNSEIRITDTGQRFIRNICHCLDEGMVGGTTTAYSKAV